MNQETQVVKSNQKKEKLMKENKKWFLLIILGLGFAFLTKGITLFFSFFGFFMAKVNMKKMSEITKHIEGEERLYNLLSKLPKDYSVVRNTCINNGDKKVDLENVVIGPSGVFLLKTVSKEGKIYGSYKDEVWLKGEKSKEKMEYFMNPIQSVFEDSKELSKYLKDQKAQSWIQSIVYFSHNDSELFITDDNIPVFLNNEAENEILLDYIVSYQKEIIFNEKKDRITSLLQK